MNPIVYGLVHVEQPLFFRAARPLVHRLRVEIRLHRAEVEIEDAERLRAVDERQDAARARAAAQMSATGSRSPELLLTWVTATSRVRAGLIVRPRARIAPTDDHAIRQHRDALIALARYCATDAGLPLSDKEHNRR